jgi:3-phenylpropionate/trans-cinnamate dioxygenase ferredoxin subunit
MVSIQVTTTSELPVGSMRAFPVGETRILVAHCADGYYAISAVCTHMGGDLSRGRLEDFIVACPRHGARFDVRTGANEGPAKIGPIKMKPADVKSYPVTIEGDAISVTVE